MMKMSFRLLLIILSSVLLLNLIGCSPTNIEPIAQTGDNPVQEIVEPTEAIVETNGLEEEADNPKSEPKELITWFQYDQNNEDPASDERVGNEYLRGTIPEFNSDHEGEYIWVNVPKAWDKMRSEIVTTVMANGDVPDLYEGASDHIPTFYGNGTMMDLKDWAQQQPWYSDLDTSAINACTAPDGSLLCIPMANRPHLTFYWKQYYPNGYPTSPEQFLIEAERLKSEGVYAWTFFGSTDFGGNGATRLVWDLISSFGGTYDDGEGNMLLNTPENVAAIEFLRKTVLAGYNPDTVFAGGFIEEDSFKDGSAGAIPTGLMGYRFLNPLTAPDGTKYDTGTEQDIMAAIADGKLSMAPMFAPEGKNPGCNIYAAAFFIPSTAKNAEGAMELINWIMSDVDRHVEFALYPGSGFPTLKSASSHPDLQTPFYLAAADTIAKSSCRNHVGSLERREQAEEKIMITIFKLLKENTSLSIPEALQAAQEEYNMDN